MEKSNNDWGQIRQASHVTHSETEAKLDEVLRTAHQTLDISEQSKMSLHRQGETIEKIDKDLDKIDRNLKKSEYIVKGMSSTFGFIKSLFVNPKKFDKKEESGKI